MNAPVATDINDISLSYIVKHVASKFNGNYSTNIYTTKFLKQKHTNIMYSTCFKCNFKINNVNCFGHLMNGVMYLDDKAGSSFCDGKCRCSCGTIIKGSKEKHSLNDNCSL